MAEGKKTNYAMKVLFCFGITFITAGHVIIKSGSAGLSFAFNLFPIQGFHVAIFVFAAGYFYNSRHEAAPLKFLMKKVQRLIVPLYLLTFVYAALTFALSFIGYEVPRPVTLKNLFLDPIFSGHAFWLNCPLWFVAPFFLAQMVDFGLRLLLRVRESKVKEAILIVLYLAVGYVTASITLHYLGVDGFREGTCSIWVLLGRTGFFMPFFAFGRAYKVFLEPHDTLPNWAYFAIVIALQLVALCLTNGSTTYIISWCRFSTGRIMPFVAAALGIAFWLRVSRLLAPALENSKTMNLIADNTFSIMAHQFLGFFIINLAFAGLAAVGIIHGFSLDAVLTERWYYWYPHVLKSGAARAFGIVYIAGAMAISVGIHQVWAKIYSYAKSKLPARKA